MASSPRMNEREVRRGLRTLHDQAKSQKAELSMLENGKLMKLVQEGNKLLDNIEKPKDQAKESSVFELCTEAAFEATKKLLDNQGRSIMDLILVLRSRFVAGPDPQQRGKEDPRAFNWHMLDQEAAHVFSMAPGVNCMLGPLDAQAKARKAPVQRQKRALVAVVRPDEVHVAEGAGEKQETDHVMNNMWNVLFTLGEAGCPVAELTCNYTSFSQTVENMFTLSFLVRDQRVQLSDNPQVGMMARAVTVKKKPGEPGAGTQSQFVMSLTRADWEVLREIVGEAGCKMPHRDNSDDYEATVQKRRRRA